MGRSVLIACAIDNSFCLFDFERRVDGEPKFIQKYATIAEPLQVETMGSWILVACESAGLGFYQIEG
jgi:hypothetical protein